MFVACQSRKWRLGTRNGRSTFPPASYAGTLGKLVRKLKLDE
jgi:hypothetical protein